VCVRERERERDRCPKVRTPAPNYDPVAHPVAQ